MAAVHKEKLEIMIHVHGKRQTSDLSWEFLRIENKQIETVQNNSFRDKTGVKLLIFE